MIVGFVAAVMTAMALTTGAITCNQVVKAGTPCLRYVTFNELTPECCTSFKGLYSQVKSRADGDAVCKCNDLPHDYTRDRYNALPRVCNINNPYANCS